MFSFSVKIISSLCSEEDKGWKRLLIHRRRASAAERRSSSAFLSLWPSAKLKRKFARQNFPSLLQMSRHECGLCRAHLHTSDGHSECVICSGVKGLSIRARVIPCWHRSRVLHSSHGNMIHRCTSSVRISTPRLQRTVWSLSVDLRRKLPLMTPCHWQLQMGMLHRGSRLPFIQRVQCRQRTGSHLHEGRGGTQNLIVISRRACPQPSGQMVPARTLPANPPHHSFLDFPVSPTALFGTSCLSAQAAVSSR